MSENFSASLSSPFNSPQSAREKQKLFELYRELHCIDPQILAFWDIPLAPFTAFATGGNADLLLLPQEQEQVSQILQLCAQKQLSPSILGGGANVLVADAGVRGPVVCLRNLRGIDWQANSRCLTAGAGWDISALCEFAAQNNASGLHHFYGLPGSLGGAVYMNARCYESEMAEIVQRVLCIPCQTDSEQGRLYAASSPRWVDLSTNDWQYKYSHFQQDSGHELAGAIIIAVQLQLSEQDSSSLQREMQSFLEDRIVKGHFRLPCGGSFFKNNRAFGAPTGQIIDGIGLKGLRCGAAQLAPWHGNIIVNTGSAQSSEIWELACRIWTQVYQRKGWQLEAEVQRLGAWNPEDQTVENEIYGHRVTSNIYGGGL